MGGHMSSETKNKVIGKINKIKSNIEKFIADVNVNDLKSSLNLMVKDAQKDFNNLVEKDLEKVRKKLKKEKEDFDAKAKKFLDGYKRELSSLEDKIDKLIKAKTKLTSSKNATSKKDSGDLPSSRKKILKKASKVTAKPGYKSKPLKKSTAKKV